MEETIAIRNATPDDAELICRCLLAAMGILDMGEEPTEEHTTLIESLKRNSTNPNMLYNYTQTRVAEVDGKPVGCIISYSGDEYEQLREVTFENILKYNNIDLRDNPLETGPGEYYLDCMAILPEYRGRKIGHMLMKDASARGFASGAEVVTLLVDKSHPRLLSYYRQTGFEELCEMDAFGCSYIKMIAKNKAASDGCGS